MSEKYKVPKKGAGRKLAGKLKELGKKNPPRDLVEKINESDRKKVAAPSRPAPKDLEA